MPDVEEETLRNNLGHLPTSVFPGHEGLCVIMGHRDTQFSILKYCEIGDSITIKSNNICYEYTVFDINIISSDSLLQFDAIEGVGLALVTCYPFIYSGHAPQKIIMYAELS
jgi:sortase A